MSDGRIDWPHGRWFASPVTDVGYLSTAVMCSADGQCRCQKGYRESGSTCSKSECSAAELMQLNQRANDVDATSCWAWSNGLRWYIPLGPGTVFLFCACARYRSRVGNFTKYIARCTIWDLLLGTFVDTSCRQIPVDKHSLRFFAYFDIV